MYNDQTAETSQCLALLRNISQTKESHIDPISRIQTKFYHDKHLKACYETCLNDSCVFFHTFLQTRGARINAEVQMSNYYNNMSLQGRTLQIQILKLPV